MKKMKYKCIYTARLGAPCPIMWSHTKPHPDHCHAYDCSIWRINPKLTCKYCVPLEEGEKPEKKIWCDQMDRCDSYSDGGIKECINCPAKTIVFNPTRKKSSDKVLEKRVKELEDLNRLKDIDIKNLEERNERLEEMIECDTKIISELRQRDSVAAIADVIRDE